MRIAALFNNKAAKWVKGRRDVSTQLNIWRKRNVGKLFWFHCASLGEFEQGRPVIELLKKQNPRIKILLTFFSPSGYEVRKNYIHADYVCYLPADTPSKAREFVTAANADCVFMVKYEYWANYYFTLAERKIPIYLVSAILRPEQRFFGAAGFFWKKVLRCVTHFFVQNEESLRLLAVHGFNNTTLSGDTRFDRVAAIANANETEPLIAAFAANSFCLAGGSTWPPDDDMLIRFFYEQKSKGVAIKLILVPHETEESHISRLHRKIPEAVRWSNITSTADVLIVDTTGLLNKLYKYASAVHIGGGFGKGIHNTLEAAAWGKPVTFGPAYHKFHEAAEMLKLQCARSVSNYEQFRECLHLWMTNEKLREEAGKKAALYVQENAGASEKIIAHIQRVHL